MRSTILVALIWVFSISVFQNVFPEGEVVDIETGLPTGGGKVEAEPLDSCTDRCGDGFCQDKGCGSFGFTCCETEENCPEDCLRDKEATQELFNKLRELRKNVDRKKAAVNDSEKELDQSNLALQKGEGVITRCNYRAGSRTCGLCYCLKAGEGSTILFNRRKLRGCARLDISQVGDLSDFVNRSVFYEGTSDFDSTFICPQHFKLFTISLAEKEVKKVE